MEVCLDLKSGNVYLPFKYQNTSLLITKLADSLGYVSRTLKYRSNWVEGKMKAVMVRSCYGMIMSKADSNALFPNCYIKVEMMLLKCFKNILQVFAISKALRIIK